MKTKNLISQKSLCQSYFSVHYDYISTSEELAFDLYVNSSSLAEKEKFIRVFPKGEHLDKEDLMSFQKKYHQLYIPETQRKAYMKSLVKNNRYSTKQKTEVIKDSAIEYLQRVFDKNKEFSTEVLSETIEGCREAVESMVDVLGDYDIAGIKNLIGDLSFHDFYTYDHSINVGMYCMSIYKAIKPNASRHELMMAGLGGLLHDLGKMKIPNQILNNPGKLTEEEYAVIKTHPDLGLDLILKGEDLECSPDVDMNIISAMIHQHHENYNGTGYPQGLEGEKIHFMARICAVADFFDAITTKRAYSDVLSIEDAIGVMMKARGRKIDPAIFDIFVKQVRTIVGKANTGLSLGDDFDPSIPHPKLPLLKEVNKVSFAATPKPQTPRSSKVNLFGKKKAS